MALPVDELTALAAAYSVLVDVEAEVLVLAERPDGDGRSLEVQRALDPMDDDDRRPCLVLDAGPTHAGAVRTWSLVDATVELTLTAEATATFAAEVLRVHLAPAIPADAVRAALRHLLDDGPEVPAFDSTR